MLEQLISEHRIAMSMARELARSQPGEDRDAWLRDLADLMAEHLESEERYVGPLLDQYPREGIGPPLDLRAAALGHALVAIRDPDGFGTASSSLVEALQSHIAWVEYDVFPALVVPTWESRHMVAGRFAGEARQSVLDDSASDEPTPPEPPFWER